MRCRTCPRSAVMKLPRHNLALCPTCYTKFVQTQVARAIKGQNMFSKKDRILVAVSGGKDSLVLWSILLSLGYRADALYVDLGIGDYSTRSREKVQAFAKHTGPDTTLHLHTVAQEEGAGIKELSMLVHRPTCSTCGTIKRYQFNSVAIQHHYDVMATGHNLDDEAARLLGNVLHWQMEYLEKQSPTLPASVDGFAKKVKPLYRLTEREIAAYAVIQHIDYIVEECPMAKGSKMLMYKEALNRLETQSPGTKQSFYWRFLDQQKKSSQRSSALSQHDRTQLHPCATCGQPTTADVCSYCKLINKAKAHTISF